MRLNKTGLVPVEFELELELESRGVFCQYFVFTQAVSEPGCQSGLTISSLDVTSQLSISTGRLTSHINRLPRQASQLEEGPDGVRWLVE